MIFLTVGSQLPFDRLVKAVDEWAENNKQQEIFAQIGISNYTPKNFQYCLTMTPNEYNSYLGKADFVIAHAGMGTIISVLEQAKLSLLMPRLAAKGEHRNDHQLATAKRFSYFSSIDIANDENELLTKMRQFQGQNNNWARMVKTEVSADLISAIKNFVNED